MANRRVSRSEPPGVSVAVRVRPGAGRTRVGGRYDGPNGAALIVAVGAPAVDGKATEAVRRALADALGLRSGDVALRLGATSRDKVFTVTGNETEIATRLAALRDGDGFGGGGQAVSGGRAGGRDVASEGGGGGRAVSGGRAAGRDVVSGSGDGPARGKRSGARPASAGSA